MTYQSCRHKLHHVFLNKIIYLLIEIIPLYLFIITLKKITCPAVSQIYKSNLELKTEKITNSNI